MTEETNKHENEELAGDEQKDSQPQDTHQDNQQDVQDDDLILDETEETPQTDNTAQADSSAKFDTPPADDVTVTSVVEAILFASDEPLSASRLSKIAGVSTKQVNQSIETLNEKYKAGAHAFRIEQIAGGYQMLTLSSYNIWLQRLLNVRGDSKLSPAALETLAIISYKQPIIRADIEAIRGVQCGEVIRSLMFKGLVKIIGRAEVLGRPMLYGTTKRFLEVFGLNTLKDLPKVEELKSPDA